MNLKTKQCYTSRDVIFIENVFPFSSSSENSSSVPLFPTQVTITDSDIDTPLCMPTTEPPLQSITDVTEPQLQSITETSAEVPATTSISQPLVRPARNKAIPSKFKDYTGLP